MDKILHLKGFDLFMGIARAVPIIKLNDAELEFLAKIKEIDLDKIHQFNYMSLDTFIQRQTPKDDINEVIFYHYVQLVNARYKHEITTLQRREKGEIEGTHGYDPKKHNGGIDGTELTLTEGFFILVNAGVHYLYTRQYRRFKQVLIYLQVLYLYGQGVWQKRDIYQRFTSKGGKERLKDKTTKINELIRQAYDTGLRSNIEIGKYVMRQQFKPGANGYKKFDDWWNNSEKSQNARYKQTILPKIKIFLEGIKHDGTQ